VGVCDLSLRFLLNRNQVVHPRTLMTRNYFLLHPLDQKDFQRAASPVLSVVSGGS
jgi:hypothetical protein